jgi:hypothetical protein
VADAASGPTKAWSRVSWTPMANVLVVHGLLDTSRQTNVDYAMSFASWPHGHRIHTTNIFAPWSNEMLDRHFDLLVVTYEVSALRTLPEWLWVRKRLEKARSLCRNAILFVQDDYTSPAFIDSLACDLDFSTLFSPLADFADLFYPKATQRGVGTRHVLTGYIHPDRAVRQAALVRPLRERRVDLGQRVSLVPDSFGDQARIKSSFAGQLARLAEASGLAVDVEVATTAPLLGDAWFDFLGSTRFVPGALGGASSADVSGKNRRHQARWMLLANLLPGAQGLARRDKYLTHGTFRAIGPRLFEAAMTRTCQVLLEGEYLPELTPDVNYISVPTGPSHLEKAVQRMRDLAEAEEMVDSTWRALVSTEKYLLPTAVASWLQESGVPPVGPASSGEHSDEQTALHAYLALDSRDRFRARQMVFDQLPVRSVGGRRTTARKAERTSGAKDASDEAGPAVRAGAENLANADSLGMKLIPESLLWPWTSPNRGIL